MARVYPQSSFESAARHLFRHIHEAAVLRDNPLVHEFFTNETRPRSEVLKAIHARILSLAEALCADASSGRTRFRRGRRQRDIVAALCAGESPGATAARLRVSRSHYYRERSAICARIARALNSPPVRAGCFAVRDDPLRLLFKRAESLRDAGRAHAAVHVLEEAHQCVAGDLARSAVSLGLAEELVFLGRHTRAKELLARSHALSDESPGDGRDDWLRDVCRLNRARLQSQLDGGADSGTGLERLAKGRIAGGRSDDLTFDAVFLTGEYYRNSGRYEEARAMLRHLGRMDQRSSYAVGKRQIAIFLLTAYCAEDSRDDLAAGERALRDALELSIAGGTVVGALLAICGLIERGAAAGRDGEAYVMAHEALDMAKSVDFDGFVGWVSTQIAGALMPTRYWRALDPLVFEAEKLTAPGSLGRALLKHAQGNLLMRIGHGAAAREALLEARDAARSLKNGRLEGLVLRDRALAASGAGAVADRNELMREAIGLVERYGSAADSAATYAAAARILKGVRVQRLARNARPAAPYARPPLPLRRLRLPSKPSFENA